MNEKQPEALRLADVCEATTADPMLCNAYSITLLDSAAELRRLHAVNVQMLEALLGTLHTLEAYCDDAEKAVRNQARAAIAAIAAAEEQPT